MKKITTKFIKKTLARNLREQDLFDQLAGGQRKLIALTGANNFVRVADDAVSFRFKGSPKANWVKYTLTGADLYDVQYGKIRGTNFKVIKESKGLFDDMIREDFEKNTKLFLML